MTRFLTLLCVLFAAGCQTVPLRATPSGRPEIIVRFDPTATKAKVVGYFLNRGWKVVQSSDVTVVLEHDAQPTFAVYVNQCGRCAEPVTRTTVTLVPMGSGTRVVAEADLVGNPGAGFLENRLGMSQETGDMLQTMLAEIAAGQT